MHQLVLPTPLETQRIASLNWLVDRMLTDIGPLQLRWRGYGKASGTVGGRNSLPFWIVIGTFHTPRVGCFSSALRLSTWACDAVSLPCVTVSWSSRFWVRPVRDRFALFNERMAAWLLLSSR